MPNKLQKRWGVSRQAGPRHQTGIESNDRPLLACCSFQSSLQGICPHDVAELACGVALSPRIFLSLLGGMSQFLGRIIFGVRNPSLLKWIMGSTGSDDNAGLLSQVGAHELEKQGMSNMIDCESGLDLISGVVEIEDLQSSIENKGFDGWIALFRVVCSEGTDLCQAG